MVDFSSALFGDTSESVLKQVLSEYEKEAVRSFYFGTTPFPERAIRSDHSDIEFYSKLMADWVNDGFDTFINDAINKREYLIGSILTDEEKAEVIDDVFASYVIDADYLRQWIDDEFSDAPPDVKSFITPPNDDESMLALYLYGLVHGMYRENPYSLSEMLSTYKYLIWSVVTKKNKQDQRNTQSKNAKKNMSIFNYEKMLTVFGAISNNQFRNKTELYLSIAEQFGNEISSMEQKGRRRWADFKCWHQLVKFGATEQLTLENLKNSREIVIKLGNDIEERFEDIKKVIQKHIERLKADGNFEKVISYRLPAFER